MFDLKEIPGLTLVSHDGVTSATMNGPFDFPYTCKYWEVSGHTMEGQDRWRSQLAADINGMGVGPFSHPSKHGCEIAIRKHFVEIGCLSIPDDNTHLDEKDTAIVDKIKTEFAACVGRPRVGDFVILSDGRIHRCCHAWDDGMQTTTGGSFHIMRNGLVSYSGGLDPSKLWERFEDTGKTRIGRFWIFHHDLAGAGRGVDVNIPCRVYKLNDISMTEAEARAHPAAKSSAEFWGEGHREHLTKIAKLMNGEL